MDFSLPEVQSTFVGAVVSTVPNLQTDDVTILLVASLVPTGASSRRLLRSSSIHVQDGLGVNVQYQILVFIESLGYDSPSIAREQILLLLSQSTTNGLFTQNLEAAATQYNTSSIFHGVAASSPTVSSYSVVNDNDDVELAWPLYAVIILPIGFAVLLLLGWLLYPLIVAKSSTYTYSQRRLSLPANFRKTLQRNRQHAADGEEEVSLQRNFIDVLFTKPNVPASEAAAGSGDNISNPISVREHVQITLPGESGQEVNQTIVATAYAGPIKSSLKSSVNAAPAEREGAKSNFGRFLSPLRRISLSTASGLTALSSLPASAATSPPVNAAADSTDATDCLGASALSAAEEGADTSDPPPLTTSEGTNSVLNIGSYLTYFFPANVSMDEMEMQAALNGQHEIAPEHKDDEPAPPEEATSEPPVVEMKKKRKSVLSKVRKSLLAFSPLKKKPAEEAKDESTGEQGADGAETLVPFPNLDELAAAEEGAAVTQDVPVTQSPFQQIAAMFSYAQSSAASTLDAASGDATDAEPTSPSAVASSLTISTLLPSTPHLSALLSVNIPPTDSTVDGSSVLLEHAVTESVDGTNVSSTADDDVTGEETGTKKKRRSTLSKLKNAIFSPGKKKATEIAAENIEETGHLDGDGNQEALSPTPPLKSGDTSSLDSNALPPQPPSLL